jgi:hypothetical protein
MQVGRGAAQKHEVTMCQLLQESQHAINIATQDEVAVFAWHP